MRETSQKVQRGQMRDSERERARVKWVHTLVVLASECRKQLADNELDEMDERLERIKRLAQNEPIQIR